MFAIMEVTGIIIVNCIAFETSLKLFWRYGYTQDFKIYNFGDFEGDSTYTLSPPNYQVSCVKSKRFRHHLPRSLLIHVTSGGVLDMSYYYYVRGCLHTPFFNPLPHALFPLPGMSCWRNMRLLPSLEKVAKSKDIAEKRRWFSFMDLAHSKSMIQRLSD